MRAAMCHNMHMKVNMKSQHDLPLDRSQFPHFLITLTILPNLLLNYVYKKGNCELVNQNTLQCKHYLCSMKNLCCFNSFKLLSQLLPKLETCPKYYF